MSDVLDQAKFHKSMLKALGKLGPDTKKKHLLRRLELVQGLLMMQVAKEDAGLHNVVPMLGRSGG